MTHRRPLFWATAVLTGGIAASLAGNLQAINLDNASPGVGAYISAVWWPLSLFGVVELLIHTPWMATWRDRATKGAVLVAVAAVAAWVSYWHLANVLSHYGYDVASRYAGPVAVDMAMVLAALAMDRIGQARQLSKAGQLDTLANDVDSGQLAKTGHVDTLASEVATVQLDTRTVGQMIADAGNAGQVDKPELPPLAVDTLDVQPWTDRLANLSPDVLDTDVDLLARLDREMATEYPNLAVDISALQDGPAARRARPASMTAERSAQALEYAQIGKQHGLLAKEIAEALAAWSGVSTRTIRRLPWWTPLMQGTEAS